MGGDRQARLKNTSSSGPGAFAAPRALRTGRGRFPGNIEHDKPPIPVRVHVEWVDGGESDLDGWTAQWTRTHVCIMRSLEPGRLRAFWVRASNVRRRE